MYGSTLLNTKLSAVISILSGIGFITVLSITPINQRPQKGKFIEEKEESPLSKSPYKKENVFLEKDKKEEEQKIFSIRTIRKLQKEFSESIWGSGFPKYPPDVMIPFYNENQMKPYQNLQPDVITYYKDDKISVNTIGDTRVITNQILEYKYQNKTVDSPTLFQNKNSQLRNIEISYQLNSNFSANFKSSQFDIFDDKLKQYPTNMAGISYTGSKYISSGFIAGESTLNNPYRYNQNQVGFLNGNNYYRDMELPYKDTDRVNKNLFEWQTNIAPTKNLLFQTAVYNSNRSLINETNVTEGARLAMAVGLKYFILNLKYNYLSDNLMRTMLRPDAASAYNKDYAALGFTFFIDKYKRYSIYIGNNYYNITVANRPTDSSNSVSTNNSYSASFRGRNNDYYNTTFFLNFKNNANRDYYYSNFGVFRLPVNSQLNFEYATSLGLELSF